MEKRETCTHINIMTQKKTEAAIKKDKSRDRLTNREMKEYRMIYIYRNSNTYSSESLYILC